MKYIHVTEYTVAIKDNKQRRIYYHVTPSSIERVHCVLAGCPKRVIEKIYGTDTVYAVSDNPAVMSALYITADVVTRPLDSIVKGAILWIDHLAFEVVKVNPKNIKLRRAAMRNWPEPDKMHLRFTTYTRDELFAEAHPMTRQEAAQLIHAGRLLDKGLG